MSALRRRRTPAALLCLLALTAACGAGTPRAAAPARRTTTAPRGAPGTTAPANPAVWLTYGGGPARDAVDPTSPALGRSPTEAWVSPALDGPVYGQPLIDGGTVLVATENDTVDALAAASGAVEWSRHLGTPVPAAALPCGDITPTVGVTSTMVVDPASDTVFASAAVDAGGAVEHELVALDVASGAVRWQRRIDQPGWTAAAQLQRAALALDHGEVLVGFGGNEGDCGRYHGWVVGVPASGSGPLEAYEVPTRREGAV
ncbi:MAG TPA: PQQ-binding-like beta-propeller repeat protein, partial [Acidimicrobiales bacterium]|nr:PQQ-binding-like beta-propeller repeat protein [Acidimicrobiales bacterium]